MDPNGARDDVIDDLLESGLLDITDTEDQALLLNGTSSIVILVY